MATDGPDASVDIIDLALAEDIGDGDVTVRFFSEPYDPAEAVIFAKQECVLAGVGVAEEVFRRVDAGVDVELLRRDGCELAVGDEVLRLSGRVGAILTAERTALNFIQRLSGVATRTRQFVEAVAGTGAIILDTRKTTPGFRELEKAAVCAGGGTNHRSGLYDMAMVKDNHLAARSNLERIRGGIERLKAERPAIPIELEADTVDQVRDFLSLPGVDRILLDNMTLPQLQECVELSGGTVPLEASGGVTLQTVRAIAETGVDFISVGSLTHSAVAVDFSLELTAGRGS